MPGERRRPPRRRAGAREHERRHGRQGGELQQRQPAGDHERAREQAPQGTRGEPVGAGGHRVRRGRPRERDDHDGGEPGERERRQGPVCARHALSVRHPGPRRIRSRVRNSRRRRCSSALLGASRCAVGRPRVRRSGAGRRRHLPGHVPRAARRPHRAAGDPEGRLHDHDPGHRRRARRQPARRLPAGLRRPPPPGTRAVDPAAAVFVRGATGAGFTLDEVRAVGPARGRLLERRGAHVIRRRRLLLRPRRARRGRAPGHPASPWASWSPASRRGARPDARGARRPCAPLEPDSLRRARRGLGGFAAITPACCSARPACRIEVALRRADLVVRQLGALLELLVDDRVGQLGRGDEHASSLRRSWRARYLRASS